jgi:hypothetical protein
MVTDDDVAAAVEAARVRLGHMTYISSLTGDAVPRYGDPLAAIRYRLAECVVLAEAAGIHERQVHIFDDISMTIEVLLARAIAATKEAE